MKQEKTTAPDFWNDAKAAEGFLKEVAAVKYWVNNFDEAKGLQDDLETLFEFGEDAAADIDKAAVAFQSKLEDLETRHTLSEEGDNLPPAMPRKLPL